MLVDYVIIGCLLTVAVVCLCTAWLWIPALIISAPIWLPSLTVLALFLHFTGLKKYAFRPLTTIYNWLFYKSNRPRRYLWNKFYNVLCRLFPQAEWRTMNYGYAALSETGHLTKLQPDDEEERFSYQLYHLVASGFKSLNNLADRHVLEVGSGRGGGLSYVFRYLKPKSAIGVDFSPVQVEHCRNTYSIENLSFEQGDAEALTNIADNTVDMLINVESSHCYGNMGAFLREAHRVLKPGGYFSLADFRGADQVDELETAINECGLELQKKVDITKNVLKAMALDSPRRLLLIQTRTPWYTQAILSKFSGVEGSTIYNQMETGETVYLGYLLTKPS